MSRFYIENKGEWDHLNRKWAVEPYWLVHDGVKNVGPTRIDDQFVGEVFDSLVAAIKATSAEDDANVDQWSKDVEHLQAQIASLTAENERLRLHLAGMLKVISENYYGKIRDDDRANIEAACAALQPKEGE